MKRTVLVTGASSGIGRAIALKLLESHRVIGMSRSFAHFKPEGSFHPVEIDLSELDALPLHLQSMPQQFPDLDSIIFCAGQGRFGSLEEFSYAQIDHLMALNFISQAYLTRALLPILKRQKRGNLIFMGSEAALKGSRKGAIYCASKFALRGFAQALREECGRSGVRVTLINPGMTQTPFFDSLEFAPGSAPSQHILPEDIAELVAQILSMRAETVVDEINLSPLNHVIQAKPR